MRQEIRLGTVGANGRDGDDNRTAFGKINEMTAELYAAAIVERGTNALGSWVKFSNGLQMTWGEQTANAAVPAGQGVAWNEGVQPAPFVGGPNNVQTTADFQFYTGANATGSALYSGKQTYGSPNGIQIVGINMGSAPALAHPSFIYGSAAAQSYKVSFQSVGFWK